MRQRNTQLSREHPINLKVLLPSQVFLVKEGVKQVVAESIEGSFGILPHRLDCVAALVPGILSYEVAEEANAYLAVDQGVLIKTGTDVLVSVRNAIGGADLDKLQAAVKREFLKVDEREHDVRSVLAKMESGFVRRFMEIQHG